MHDAGIRVDVKDGRLVLCQRRGHPVPDDIAAGARQYRQLLAAVVVLGGRWYQCDECGTIRLTSRVRRCTLTVFCSGTMKTLPRVTALRTRSPQKAANDPAVPQCQDTTRANADMRQLGDIGVVLSSVRARAHR
jgi:hypothetical protein